MIVEARTITTPVLVLQAGVDTAVTNEGQNCFCAALEGGDGTRSEAGKPLWIDGARHELLIETDTFRIPAVNAILDIFVRQR